MNEMILMGRIITVLSSSPVVERITIVIAHCIN